MHIEAQNLSLYSIFVIAFLGGFGHCIGMCGGIVLAYCTRLKKTSKIKTFFFHLLYNLGRISMYILLGGVVGFVGSMISLNLYLKGALFILAGILMIFSGLSLLGKSRFLLYLEHFLQNTKWYQKSFKQILSLQNPLSLYLLGILNGLLPCGFVYAFLFGAVASSSAFNGAVIMAIFGLGTLPSLLLFGLVSHALLSKNILRKIAMNLASVAIIIFGALMAYKGVGFIINKDFAHNMHQRHHG